MATQYANYTGAAVLPIQKHGHPLAIFNFETHYKSKNWRGRARRSWGIRASNGGDSYLDMWKKAVERERKAAEFQKIAENSAEEEGERTEVLERKSNEFQKILEVSSEERDRIQRMQVIDRAAAAIAAAQALLKESSSEVKSNSDPGSLVPEGYSEMGAQLGGKLSN